MEETKESGFVVLQDKVKNKSIFQQKTWVILFSILCMFLWGSAIPATKLSYQSLELASDEVFTRIYFAGLRFFIASFMVFIYLFIQRKNEHSQKLKELTKKNWVFLILIGLLRITLCYYFYYIALANISGVKGSVLVSASTFITVLLAPFFVKEDRFTLTKLLALVLGFAGIIVANWSKGFDMSFHMRGEGFMLLSGVFTALVEVLVKPKAKGIQAPIITWGQLLIGSLPLLVIGYLGLEHALEWNSLSISLLIYGSIISAVAFILWYELLKVNHAGELAIYRLFIPIFGAVISAIILPNEAFTFSLILGIVLVVLGIAILNMGNQKNMTRKRGEEDE